MCGRTDIEPEVPEVMRTLLDAEWAEGAPFTPGGDIRPTNDIPGIRLLNGQRVASNYLWGFMPPNAPGRKFVSEYFSFNARADKIASGRLYAKPFREARCLVVVSAWYEWPKPPGVKKGIPCTIKPAQEKVFVFAGMWGPWKDAATGQAHDTATIITTDPNATIADLPHHRMPALLPKEAWSAWLDPTSTVAELQDMLKAAPEEWLEVVAGGPKPTSYK